MRHLASMFLAWARENNAFSKFYATSYIQQELQACKRGLYTLFAILEALGWVTYRNPERGIRIKPEGTKSHSIPRPLAAERNLKMFLSTRRLVFLETRKYDENMLNR